MGGQHSMRCPGMDGRDRSADAEPLRPLAGMTLTCPHCGLQAFGAWRKLALGAAARARCGRCGLAVGVAPLPALAALIPCLAVVAAALLRWITSPVSLAALGAAAIGITSAIHLALPLVPRGLTDARAVRAARGQAPAEE